MTDKMTLDELIAFIQEDADWLRECNDADANSKASAIEVIIEKILANRPALAVGMRETLRFELIEDEPGYWIPQFGGDVFGIEISYEVGFEDKNVAVEYCEAIADSLDMTAEFVGETE